ncbi:PREDICTED: inter-alpha-trypsin inhibitor heavy chain H6 [Nanorana parkeri]|uniref:inter-alpha-trypsin inhibitor heavy chain H6 n=1 Tax=Nanorana parkeri TaxID=125878 RepID=UPI000853F548|nr:PREDICTED: inter-alpha-trypsin inhibitor heavy chain H6 [Nanorana parkeri]
MGNLFRRDIVLLMALLSVAGSLPRRSPLDGPHLKRFKRQLRATKTELKISSLYIQSTIVSRYAHTKVQTLMVNPHAESKEAIFELELPSSAFISNFTLTVNGKTHVAEVKEKHQAKKMYDEARRQGKTTAHVGTRDRETEKFRVSVNVESGGEITFALTYEELLRRQLGKYEHAVSVRPGQIVQNLTVQVTISERTGMEYVRVLPLRTSRLITNAVRGETKMPPSTEVEKSPHCARVTFSPTPKEQAAQSSTGIAADFVIQYDVALKDLAGDVQIYNGYFVHYFAPRGLPTIQKNVIFVIDVSGSMFGTKMKQTKSAMFVILNDLHRDDHFNIITFSDVVQAWRPGTSIQATAQNIKSAKEYVNKIEADGWTDINAALLAAASIFNKTSSKAEKGGTKQKIPLVIFLTDGEATSGVTSSARILENAHKALGGTISLFCLAFGDDADYNLMRRLSLENRGIARRIYEYSDATLQLKGFYDEIASPLLFDIELAYLGETAQNVTQTLFPNYFEGSELVVAGKVKPGAKNLQVRMTAHNQKERLSLENDISVVDNATEASFGCSGNVDEIQWFVKRLWAYFTIQDLLQARIKANDTVARKILTEKATNLSLKYNFVTPVTSLIVVKPDDPDDPKTTTATTTAIPSTATTPLTASPQPTVTTTSPRAKMTTTARLTKPVTKPPKPSTTAKISATKSTTSRATISQITVTRGQSGVTQGLTTSNTLEKLTTKASVSAPSLTTSSVIHHNTNSLPTSTLHPSSLVPTGTTLTRTEKLPRTSIGSENHTNSLVSTGTTLARTEKLPRTSISSENHTNYLVSTGSTLTRTEKLPRTSISSENHTNTLVSTGSTLTRTEKLPRTSISSENHTNTLVSTGSTLTRTEKLPRTSISSENHTNSLVSTSVPTVTVTESAQETTTGTLSASSYGTAFTTPGEGVVEGVEEFHTTSFPVNPTHPRLLILPEDTELLPGTFSYPNFVESLNPPPVYSYFEEITGVSSKTYSTEDSDYEMIVDPFMEPDIDYDVSVGAPMLQTFMSSVDGDPHFVVNLPQIQEKLCFTLDGRPGDTLKLLTDPVTGITVSGHLTKAPPRIGHEDRLRTYLNVVTVNVNQPRSNYIINVTLDSLTLRGEKELTLPVNRPALLRKPRLAVRIFPSSNITVWIGRNVELLIIFHHYQHPTYLQLNHLGFYIVKGHGLSSSSGGLLGQFQHSRMEVAERKQSDDLTLSAVLKRNDRTAPAVLAVRPLKDSAAQTHMSKCWLVKHAEVEQILDGPYMSYVASGDVKAPVGRMDSIV